ncbi:Crp/Fnr family transcriptional regulator [Listeria rustica]|uniref:Crp/Fnr family transcriptional regulator n=1 Tax=Listeria rustica TaxID=2713503 RepID=A0A7W1YG52_9LIST|nr:Crp/Fnr family transcriptional regulator [Listeria rustica]MBA3926268.1 Crp/Fnr family transcriptional regulator [Listeria rustica]
MELFDKGVIEQAFSSTQLLKVLSDKNYYPIDREKVFFNKKEILCSEDEVQDSIYFIQAGICESSRQGHTMSFIGKHDIVGISDIMGNEESFVSVIALTNTVAWRFSKEEVISKLVYSQEGAFYLYHYMKMMNMELLEKYTLLTLDTKEQLIGILTHLGGLYGEDCLNQIKLPKIFAKQIIANYMGASRQHISRLCKQLEMEGIFEIDEHRFILNKKEVAHV